MLDAFAQSDLDGVRKTWAEGSEFSSFKVEFDITRAGYDQISFVNPNLSRWQVESDRATVRLSFSMKGRDRSNSQWLLHPLVWDFGLVSVNGAWLISTWDVPRGHLDTRLLQMGSRDERRAFLEREKELLDLRLVLSLIENGNHLAEAGDHVRGGDQIALACEISEILNAPAGRAACYKAQGDLFSYQYKHTEALDSYERSLPLFKLSGGLKGARAAQLGIGNVYVYLGEYSKALGAFKDALALGQEIPELAGDAVSLKQIGIVYASIGLYNDAVESYIRSLGAAEQARDELAEASALINLGNTYFQLGRFTEAEKSYSRALRVYEDLGDERSEAGARINLGNYYVSEGNYEKALEQYDRSARIGRQLEDALLIAATQNAIGHVYLLKSQYDEARRHIEKSLQFAREAGMRQEEASRLLELGFLDSVTGKDDQALLKYSRAQAIATEIQHIDTVFRSHNFIGDLRLRQQNWSTASDAFQRAVTDIEYVREHAGSPLLQTSFFAQFASSYGGLIKSSYEMRKFESALNASEAAKARTLVGIMRAGGATPNKSLTASERLQERRLLGRITGITNALDALKANDHVQLAELNKQLSAVRSDYEMFRDRLFVEHTQLRAQRAEFAPLPLEAVHKALFTNNPGLRILSYSITDHGVFLFVLTPTTRDTSALKVYELKSVTGQKLTEKELRERVTTFRQGCSHEDAPYKTLARELYKVLLAPARQEVEGANHIVIIPDGILLTLPFQALINNDGQHLLETASISYAPSITALIEMLNLSDRGRAPSQPGIRARGVLAMGVGSFDEIARYRGRDLPWADQQARIVAALIGGRELTGRNATEGRAKRLIGQARYVHFVTHGEVNSKAPMFSSIVLKKSTGEDGWLFARELMDLNLHADLVTLAACQTALGQETRGEGLLGLSWAMFVAGSKSSLVTQWEVLDTSTNELMLNFYRLLKTMRYNNKAKALQMAQLDLMKQNRYRHPYYWAPFTMVGDWR